MLDCRAMRVGTNGDGIAAAELDKVPRTDFLQQGLAMLGHHCER
jgi:hypothetical protein